MEDNNFNELIKKALDIYDEKNNLYKKYINDIDTTFDNYEILGYYDNENKIWIWGWMLPETTIESSPICNQLLNYGLNIDPINGPSEHYFIKSLLLNSRILIDNKIQLDIHLAVCMYIIKDAIKFIYPVKYYLDESKQKYITYYYLVKKI
jgi:hypothetical protein